MEEHLSINRLKTSTESVPRFALEANVVVAQSVL